MAKQILALNTAADMPVALHMPIHPVQCFVDGEWGLFAKPFSIDGVLVMWPKALADLVQSPGPLTAEHVTALGIRLAERLPPA